MGGTGCCRAELRAGVDERSVETWMWRRVGGERVGGERLGVDEREWSGDGGPKLKKGPMFESL